MTVLELLDELDDILDKASPVPLTGKVMIDKQEAREIIDEIRSALPDDVKQARWLKDEKERILDDAKTEYKKLIMEAKKQADFMVDNNDITLKARKHADAINEAADQYAKVLKMRTYDYLDKILYDLQGRMQEMNEQYIGQMFNTLENTFEGVQQQLEKNRDEIKNLAERTQNGEEWIYQKNDEQPSEES
ncbi:MAG: hypothetical protein PUC44_04605 [Eubacteriales bacterium]|nr:hypothetical protein [Eubacteriales bacterium]